MGRSDKEIFATHIDFIAKNKREAKSIAWIGQSGPCGVSHASQAFKFPKMTPIIKMDYYDISPTNEGHRLDINIPGWGQSIDADIKVMLRTSMFALSVTSLLTELKTSTDKAERIIIDFWSGDVLAKEDAVYRGWLGEPVIYGDETCMQTLCFSHPSFRETEEVIPKHRDAFLTHEMLEANFTVEDQLLFVFQDDPEERWFALYCLSKKLLLEQHHSVELRRLSP